MTIVPVILSGGSGTRLWPMSRPEMPKQLLPLTADETMLQLTARRAHGEAFAAPIVVANARHADAIDEQLAAADAKPQAVILEPVGRNTAPAIALAALAAGAEDALLVMPSDHVIADVEAFRAAVDAAKHALGERGPVWWTDGAPDYNRRMAKNTPYADWYQPLAAEAS